VSLRGHSSEHAWCPELTFNLWPDNYLATAALLDAGDPYLANQVSWWGCGGLCSSDKR
jgi:hypothetical protein